MRYEGIDVSKWQGDIDFDRVKASGIQFVIARIGYGMYENQKDGKFEDNYYGATKNNIPIGVYLYSYSSISRLIWEIIKIDEQKSSFK